MKLGKWRNDEAATVKVARKSKVSFEQAIKDLTKRGYEVIWQHETGNFAELRRKSEVPDHFVDVDKMV